MEPWNIFPQPLLHQGARFPSPQRVPEAVGSTEPCVYRFFLYTHTHHKV